MPRPATRDRDDERPRRREGHHRLVERDRGEQAEHGVERPADVRPPAGGSQQTFQPIDPDADDDQPVTPDGQVGGLERGRLISLSAETSARPAPTEVYMLSPCPATQNHAVAPTSAMANPTVLRTPSAAPRRRMARHTASTMTSEATPMAENSTASKPPTHESWPRALPCPGVAGTAAREQADEDRLAEPEAEHGDSGPATQAKQGPELFDSIGGGATGWRRGVFWSLDPGVARRSAVLIGASPLRRKRWLQTRGWFLDGSDP